MDDSASPAKRFQRHRVAAACDLCRARKVKCDGNLPCAYCVSRDRAEGCVFAQNAPHQVSGRSNGNAVSRPREHSTTTAREATPLAEHGSAEDSTDVPLEARLLRDALGKVIFIGDCAPLSFLQTVRHLVTNMINADGFNLPASRDSVIEVALTSVETTRTTWLLPSSKSEIETLVGNYYVASSGLVDLFGPEDLTTAIYSRRNNHTLDDNSSTSAAFHLVLAIGGQSVDDDRTDIWVARAKEALLLKLCTDMSISTVQGFVLLAFYMLRASQPNGAYLYFSLAARIGYAVGLHRTEVNASFGSSKCSQRDRIWKSLRILDLVLSNLMGRPTVTSEIDCTVKYSSLSNDAEEASQLLDANVQISMIVERIVIEVYSRKRISVRIANHVSHQLKTWATKWLHTMRHLASPPTSGPAICTSREAVGACQATGTYFYGIMLLTRPFLIYDLYEHLGAPVKPPSSQVEKDERRKFADAAIDAAIASVESWQRAITAGIMPVKMPVVISWLFTTSLVLAVGILGRFGLSLESPCKQSILCLDHFAQADPHARQYSMIVQALLIITVKHAQCKESRLRLRRKQASSELFGLTTFENDERNRAVESPINAPGNLRQSDISLTQESIIDTAEIDWTIYDGDFFALPNENDPELQDFLQPGKQTLGGSLADIPLFHVNDPTTSLP